MPSAKSLLFIILSLTVSLALQAQADFRKGYIIKLNNDTASGLIKFKGDIGNSLSCTFKKNLSNEEEFKPGEINGYRFTDGKYYVSKYVRGQEKTSCIFAEYLVEGKKNLYFGRDKKGFHFYIDLNNDTITEVPYKEEFITRNGTTYKKESTIHRSLLKSYFKESPVLFPEIENLKKPDFGNMIKLTKDYHHIACSDSCIVYYKKPALKVFIEPQFGLMNFDRGISNISSGSFASSGVSIYFWMPKANEHLYFKSGLMISSVTTDVKYLLTKIPLQFEYLFRTKYVRPRVDLGVNYYSLYTSTTKDHLLTLACSTGVLLKISDTVSIDLGVSSDLWAFVYGTPFFVSHSLETGLRIKL